MKMDRFLFALSFMALLFVSCKRTVDKVDLSGEWTVVLDSLDEGVTGAWYSKTFTDKITLPGTLCDAGYGIPCNVEPKMEKEVFLNLKRKFDYVGPAWYQKEVNIPQEWREKNIFLTLERVIWNSQVWVNGQKVNTYNESLTTPHRFDLSTYLVPGKKNVITLRIDNRKQHDTSVRNLAHAYTNDTQTMWNGVLGRMVLEAKDKIYVKELLLMPDVDHHKLDVTVKVGNHDIEPTGELAFFVKDPTGKNLSSKTVEITGKEIRFSYDIAEPMLWDEFNPAVYVATAQLKSGGMTDVKQETFGMRKLTGQDALLQINDRRMFLRGTLECCIFPLKGYPPTDKASWEKVFSTAHAYGLNHFRFHSWCPPEAAFDVADKMGFYLQIELPVWSLSIGEDKETVDFLYDEAMRIRNEYGNHPSFCFWSLGNELQGDFKVLDTLLVSMKQQDSRHLYTTTTFTFEKGHGEWPEPHDDFWISQWTKKGWVRGQGIFDDYPISFNKDFSEAVKDLPVPIVTHEIGQYSVFPNLKEIEKYTGNLLPLNFEAVARDLERKGRMDWAEENLWASGKLAAILYKEEIERALKTPGFSGFQLLDLHDFPGQGTALVGLLDAFWDNKGVISAEEFRQFCSPVVPLARFDKATFTNDEIFKVSFEVANFGAEKLEGIHPVWELQNSKGAVIAQGKCRKQDLPVGNAIAIGNADISLNKVAEADRLTLTLRLQDTDFHNSWNIWVYPSRLEIDPTSDVFYTRSFVEAEKALKEGRKVLLNPTVQELNGLDGKFVQVFWSPVHFPNQPGTMGIACNPAHPALASFPTEGHSDWQWWDICKNAKTLVLDSLDVTISPIVRMVDNFYKNRNLALIFEAKVGKGKLLMCSSNLAERLEERPVAKQLRYSLLKYMNTEAFNPQEDIAFEQIKGNFHNIMRIQPARKSIYE